jgi:hypothetical protein
MSKPPPIPIRLRRQSRPAPSHEPSHGPRPELTVPPPPPPPPKQAAVAKPKPKPEPKPEPKTEPPPPPAAKPPLPAYGGELPVAPLFEADAPADASVRLGTLVRTRHTRTGRPFLMLCVPCECRNHKHFYPWRGDWPVEASVRSHQAPRCRKHKAPGGVWLGLDPERLSISHQASEEGRKAFLEWKAWWDTFSPGERTAISKGRMAAEPPGNGSDH